MAGGAGGMPQGGAGQSVMPQGGASQTPASSVMTDDFRGASGAPSMPFGQMIQQLGMGQGASYNAPAPSMVPNYGSAANPQVQPNGAVYAGPMSGTPAWGGMPPQGAPAMGSTKITPDMLFSQLYGTQSPFATQSQPTAMPTSTVAPTQAQMPAQSQMPAQAQPATTAAPGIAGLQPATTPRPPVRAKQLSTPYRRPRLYR